MSANEKNNFFETIFHSPPSSRANSPCIKSEGNDNSSTIHLASQISNRALCHVPPWQRESNRMREQIPSGVRLQQSPHDQQRKGFSARFRCFVRTLDTCGEANLRHGSRRMRQQPSCRCQSHPIMNSACQLISNSCKTLVNWTDQA